MRSAGGLTCFAEGGERQDDVRKEGRSGRWGSGRHGVHVGHPRHDGRALGAVVAGEGGDDVGSGDHDATRLVGGLAGHLGELADVLFGQLGQAAERFQRPRGERVALGRCRLGEDAAGDLVADRLVAGHGPVEGPVHRSAELGLPLLLLTLLLVSVAPGAALEELAGVSGDQEDHAGEEALLGELEDLGALDAVEVVGVVDDDQVLRAALEAYAGELAEHLACAGVGEALLDAELREHRVVGDVVPAALGDLEGDDRPPLEVVGLHGRQHRRDCNLEHLVRHC